MSSIHRLSFLVALVAGAGCAVDNTLQGEEKDPQDFDSGDPWTTGTDTTDTTTTGTTTEPEPLYCNDRHFPGEPIETVDSCPGGPATPDWELETLWEIRNGLGFNSNAVVGQLDDDDGDGDADADDVPDIVIMDGGTMLHSYRADTGSETWSLYMGSSMGAMPAIADMDGDGFPEVVMDVNYAVTALDGRDGSIVWVGPSSYYKDKGSCGAFGVADLEGDGDPEVYLGGMIVDSGGSRRGSGTEGDGTGVGNTLGMSVAADLDEDGIQEVIVGNAAYDPDGGTVWANGEDDGTVAVADLDLDGTPEIISTNQYGVTVMDAGGSVLWTDDVDDKLPSAPAVADLDGDGAPEVIIATASGLFTFRGDGSRYWDRASSGSASNRGGASAYDLNGDGKWEVVWSGPNYLEILDGETGDPLVEESAQAPTCAGPVPVVDVDGDFAAEIVVTDGAGSLKVMRDTAGFTTARTVWHQSDYSFTNVEDDGTLPAEPTPTWDMYNNFRAGPEIRAKQNLFPVIRDVCIDECDRGTVWVWYALGNNGNLDVTGTVNVEIYGRTDAGTVLLGTDAWNTTIEAGWISESAYIELTDVPAPLHDISVWVVGSTSEAEECDTTDDLTNWGSEVCPAPTE